MKLFDIRNFKKPVIQIDNMPNRYESTNLIFSPDEKYVLSGLSLEKGESIGKFGIYDSSSLELVKEVDVAVNASCTRLFWHSRINQIFAGMSDGGIQVLYNPMTSVQGIKDAIIREPRKRAVDDIDFYNGPVEIDAPEEAPQFQEEIDEMRAQYMKEKMEIQVDPRDLRKPQMPQKGDSLGSGGMMATSVKAYLMKTILPERKMNEDPREAILKFAEEAEKNPYWVDPAYKKTQPDKKLAKAVYEDEDEAVREAKKKRRL